MIKRRGKRGEEKNRDKLDKKMTAAQVTQAQKLARECVKKNYKGC